MIGRLFFRILRNFPPVFPSQETLLGGAAQETGLWNTYVRNYECWTNTLLFLVWWRLIPCRQSSSQACSGGCRRRQVEPKGRRQKTTPHCNSDSRWKTESETLSRIRCFSREMNSFNWQGGKNEIKIKEPIFVCILGIPTFSVEILVQM